MSYTISFIMIGSHFNPQMQSSYAQG